MKKRLLLVLTLCACEGEGSMTPGTGTGATAAGTGTDTLPTRGTAATTGTTTEAPTATVTATATASRTPTLTDTTTSTAYGWPIGAICTSPGQCASGFCADGHCCNTACGGGCGSCVTGTCTPKADGTICAPGVCADWNGSPCLATNSTCKKGACVAEKTSCCGTSVCTLKGVEVTSRAVDAVSTLGCAVSNDKAACTYTKAVDCAPVPYSSRVCVRNDLTLAGVTYRQAGCCTTNRSDQSSAITSQGCSPAGDGCAACPKIP